MSSISAIANLFSTPLGPLNSGWLSGLARRRRWSSFQPVPVYSRSPPGNLTTGSSVVTAKSDSPEPVKTAGSTPHHASCTASMAPKRLVPTPILKRAIRRYWTTPHGRWRLWKPTVSVEVIAPSLERHCLHTLLKGDLFESPDGLRMGTYGDGVSWVRDRLTCPANHSQSISNPLCVKTLLLTRFRARPSGPSPIATAA
jgi:hypothetical protein